MQNHGCRMQITDCDFLILKRYNIIICENLWEKIHSSFCHFEEREIYNLK